MTTDRTGPALDVERLDAAADAALGAAGVDLGAVRARAAVDGRRRARRVAVAAAAVVLLLTGLIVSGAAVLSPSPSPAAVTSGPGALPERVYRAPVILRSVTDAPIARVAVVLSGSVRAGLTAGQRDGVVLVSADGGQYRGLPETEVGRVSLAADGRVVAWVSVVGDPFDGGGGREVRWVSVSTGRSGAWRPAGDLNALPQVADLTVSPDGRRIAVSVSRPESPAAGGDSTVLDGWVVDTGTGRAELICRRCSLTGGWDGAGRLLVAAASQVPVDRYPWLGRLPGGDVRAGESVPPAGPVVLVSGDGRRRLVLDRSAAGAPSASVAYRIVELDARGVTIRAAALGRLAEAELLAWAGDRAWVRVTADPGPGASRVLQVDLRTGRSVEVLRPVEPSGPGLPSVALIAADVVAGGRTVATPAPHDPWWAPVARLLDVVRALWRPEFFAVVALGCGPFLLHRLIRSRRRGRRPATDREPTR